MLNFKKVSLTDQEFLRGKLDELNCKLLNYNFVVQFVYRSIINSEYALYRDFLILKTTFAGREQFLFPVGNGDVEEALSQIYTYSMSKNGYCYFFQFCENNAPIMMQWVEKLATRESIEYNLYDVRGEFEYIYRTESLQELKGNDLKAKRNHINYFIKHFNWSEEMITKENLPEVIAFSKIWDEKREIVKHSRLHIENAALDEIFNHYFELEIQGLLLRIENQIVAFSVGCPLCEDTFLALFEKADWEINGAYPMINREFARHIAGKYTYINRAEDTGNEGLRKAKLSYHPEYLQKVFHLDIIKK